MKSMNGIESEKVIDLTTEYEGIVEEIVKGVQDTPKTILSITVDKTVLGISDLNPETTSKNKAAHLVVSITQVKAGIEHVMRLELFIFLVFSFIFSVEDTQPPKIFYPIMKSGCALLVLLGR